MGLPLAGHELKVRHYFGDVKSEPTMHEADLEEAMNHAGTGKYQALHCTLMMATIVAAVLEMIGVAFILPAAQCDLDVPDNLKGILTSLPSIGVVVTAPFWGHASDSLGRKQILLGSLAVSGLMGLISSFMPNLLWFTLCKLACSLFLSCPSSLGYAYTSEMLPRNRRDLGILITNALVTLSTIFTPALAWLILSGEWRYDWGVIIFRPWRLLTAVYSLLLLITAVLMFFVDESPKFLMTSEKMTEALNVVKRIYSINTGKSPDSFCVTALKKADDAEEEGESSWALLRPPHLKWFTLTGFLMFTVFALINGLFLFAPDTINKAITSPSSDGTVCELIQHTMNATSSVCVDDISFDTFYIMVVTTAVYGVLIIIASVLPLAKKTLLMPVFFIVGVGCLVAGLSTNMMVAAVAMSSLQLTALGVGPLTAYAVHLFPTRLRGSSVGGVLMFGRIGSVLGSNAAGLSLNAACMATFFAFAALLFVCAGLSLLLPRDHDEETKPLKTDTDSEK